MLKNYVYLNLNLCFYSVLLVHIKFDRLRLMLGLAHL